MSESDTEEGGMDDRAIWRILEGATHNPRAREWTVLGLGVLRCYLDDKQNECLNIWSNVLRSSGVPSIHTHPWDFGSRVISGRITNARYEEVEAGLKHSQAYWRRLITSDEEPGTDTRVWLRNKQDDYVYSGGFYTQTRHEIHQTLPDNGTVTLRVPWRKHSGGGAFIYARKQWESVAPRLATVGEIQHTVDLAYRTKRGC